MTDFIVEDAPESNIEFVGVGSIVGPNDDPGPSWLGVPIELDAPLGIEAGDFLVAHLGGQFFEVGGTAFITEDGWYPLTNKTGQIGSTNEGGFQCLFYKIATAIEPDTYNFTPSTNNAIIRGTSGVISAYRGVDPVSPILAFYAASDGVEDTPVQFPTISVSIPSLTLPVATGKAILFGFTPTFTANIDANEVATAQVNSPSGAVIRYSSLGEFDNGVTPPTTEQLISNSLQGADIDVSGSATDVYTWDIDLTDTSAPIGTMSYWVIASVIVLRAIEDADPITWTVQGDPSMVDAAVNEYTMRQEGILLSPNNSDNLYTIYGANLVSKRMVIARYSRSLGTQQATAVLEGTYDIVTTSGNIPFEISNDDSGLFWCSEFEDASPDFSSGRVYRYNTATLVQETTSDWLPDDDAIIAQRCGTVGKWSEDLLFGASAFFSSVGHGVYVFDQTTLASVTEVPYSDFFTEESNGFFNDLTVDCDGNVWVSGEDNDRPHVLFRIEEGYIVTAFDVSADFPDMTGIIGLHPRLDALMIENGGSTPGVLMWDIATQTPIAASYAIPDYATGGLLQVKSSFMSQSVGVTGAGLWVSFLVYDRVPFSGDFTYKDQYCYIQKLDEDTLAVEATYVVPFGEGVVESNALSLDTGVNPYRLWSWGRYPYPQFGPSYGLGFPSWFTTPQVPADEWAPATNPTNDQLIHGRGFNYRLPVTADVPTITGSGSRTCASIPVVVPIFTCYDIDTDGGTIVVIHGENLSTVVRAIVSPYNNPYDGNAYDAPILQITSDTEIVVSVPNPGIGQGFWFLTLANGQTSVGSNQPCHPFAVSMWKTRKVWFESLEP